MGCPGSDPWSLQCGVLEMAGGPPRPGRNRAHIPGPGSLKTLASCVILKRESPRTFTALEGEPGVSTPVIPILQPVPLALSASMPCPATLGGTSGQAALGQWPGWKQQPSGTGGAAEQGREDSAHVERPEAPVFSHLTVLCHPYPGPLSGTGAILRSSWRDSAALADIGAHHKCSLPALHLWPVHLWPRRTH